RCAPPATVLLGPCCPGSRRRAAAARRGGCFCRWLGIAAAGGPEKPGCASPPLSRRQQELCKQKPELVPAIREGARLGLQECRSQFRHERWDCPLEIMMELLKFRLKLGHFESAFISAVTTAGLVHSVTRSCSAGNMTECSCDTNLRHGGSASEGWHWGGCSDDIHYGMSFSRKFLDMPIKNVTGIKATKLMSVDCRCHGVSGSCAVKTCWKTMSSFEKIGRFLKDKYENSIQISDRLKKKLRRKEKIQRTHQPSCTLWYTQLPHRQQLLLPCGIAGGPASGGMSVTKQWVAQAFGICRATERTAACTQVQLKQQKRTPDDTFEHVTP
uniref:Protein Wnt n=1 Tax=Amazona collaria TaxID=241587 RepID=A0A8B9FE53_9PSIT